MSVVETFPVILGLIAFGVASFLYVRKRLEIGRLLRSGDPIAVDGWNTFPDEPEFEGLIAKELNRAFGQFCNTLLYGLVLVAAGYGIEIKPDAFSYILDLS